MSKTVRHNSRRDRAAFEKRLARDTSRRARRRKDEHSRMDGAAMAALEAYAAGSHVNALLGQPVHPQAGR